MDIWPILLLTAGLMAFIIYLSVVVSRLFFVKKEAITPGTASLLFISFILVSSSFYMVLTEKNGILPLKNMTSSIAEQRNDEGENMQLLNQNNKMKTDLLNACLQRDGIDMLFEEFPFQVLDVSLLEEEWGQQEETLFTETNIVARFSIGDDDVMLIEDAVKGSSEKTLMEQFDLESLDRDVLDSCLAEIGELE
ncbi:hypothetical protein [Oceanobacillus oncorhynchi]|uniref:hypothetical protein n=1 Tax=Oceanobacillus oncorhynchi TaxID=545501 RepID=UPI002116AEF0|nr:hypothetical protein [Oceanobacillus oncorhynchi]UUI39950.1 hypothetical protein NP440_21950 [Oceanobacillus oncorhynchi]